MTDALLSANGIARLAEALTEHGFSRDGLVARVGHGAARDLNRYVVEPALAALCDDEPLSTLIRLFLCGRSVLAADASRALSPLPLSEALDAGLLEQDGQDGRGGQDGRDRQDHVRAGVYLHPYEQWWVVSDFPPFLTAARPHDREYVLPVGPTAAMLRRVTVPHPVGSALDLGTGCGVQALHLSTLAGHVTATDLSPRAARFAATTAALNGLDWEVLRGDMLEPVAGRRFDLVVSNPPYIVGPGTVTSFYRDSGRPGDRICNELAGAAPGLLTDGGFLQFRANWAHVQGEDWRERVASWVPVGAGMDAWIVQSHRTDAADYVDHWLRENGEEESAGRTAWLEWFKEQRIEAVGGGTVVLRRSGRRDPVVRVEELSDGEQLLGAQVAGWFERQDWLRDHDPLAARYVPAPGLVLWQEGALRGRDGWQLRRQVLRVTGSGVGWSEETTPLAVSLLGGIGSARSLREHLEQLATEHGSDPAGLVESALPHVARLVERGALLPAELADSGDS
ncbi:DUF7782 domain-containing protein [Streptomyces sp. 8N706]|uniref:DUF7782 domain-containing protein n=1 Tax=Streptomyces sp. 8N706 TaxID=3457416 RepID=UPI003FD60059